MIARLVHAQAPYDVYSCAGMVEYREAHQLVQLLPSNDFEGAWVLAIGGSDGDQALASAELGMVSMDSFAPDSWETVESMSTPRQDFQAFSWGGIYAIAMGGFDGDQVLSSTEIFNAETGTWSPGPEMTTPRTNHRAAWLDSENIFISGGFDGVAETASCEILNVVTGESVAVAPMGTARASHVLLMGPIDAGTWPMPMVAGGFNAAAGFQLASTERYDAISDSWESVGDLPVARDNFAGMSGLGGGLVTGGRVFNAEANLFEGLSEGAWFDGEAEEWVAFDMTSPHSYHNMAGGVNGSPWVVMGGADQTGIGVETTHGWAEWGMNALPVVFNEWEEGPIGSGQNPGLLDGRYKSAVLGLPGSWVVTGGDEEGIGTCAVVAGPTTNVPTVSATEGIRLFPNPAVGRVAIQGISAAETWVLVSPSGQIVEEGRGTQLDVTGLTSGTYLFQSAHREPVRLQIQAQQ